MDELINDLIKDRFGSRLYGFCQRYVRNKIGRDLNEEQLKTIEFITNNKHCLIVKGRQIGMSLLLEAVHEFYLSENKKSQLIGYADNTRLEKDLDVLIRDEMNGDDFKELNKIDYDLTKVIIASCAEGTDSFLYKEVYTSDDFEHIKIPSRQNTINMMRGVLSESELLREFCCQFIKY